MPRPTGKLAHIPEATLNHIFNLEYIGTNAELIIQAAKVLHDDVFEQEPDTPLSELYPTLDKLYALLWLIGDEGLKLEVMAIRAMEKSAAQQTKKPVMNPVAALYLDKMKAIGKGAADEQR